MSYGNVRAIQARTIRFYQRSTAHVAACDRHPTLEFHHEMP
jgi:hypothetical protein